MRISKYFQWSRVAAYFSPDFITKDLDIYTAYRPFMTVAEYNIHRAMYSKAEQWNLGGQLTPALLTTKLISAGRSSLDMFSKIETADSNVELATLHFKMTVVDVKTRKSYPLPETFKAQLAKHSSSEKTLGRFRPRERPLKVFSYSMTVRPSDTDFNGHTNQATYIQLCLDSASVVSLRGNAYINFQGDIAMYNVKTMTMWYAGESLMGDVLTCYTWEDDALPLLLHFQIELKGRTVYHNSISFYPKNISAKL